MFKIGQKVVCKNTDEFKNSTPRGIEKGKIYTIEAVSKCDCGKEVLHLQGVIKLQRWCGLLDTYTGFSASFYSYRFEILKYDIISNFEITKEIIDEKSDVSFPLQPHLA